LAFAALAPREIHGCGRQSLGVDLFNSPLSPKEAHHHANFAFCYGVTLAGNLIGLGRALESLRCVSFMFSLERRKPHIVYEYPRIDDRFGTPNSTHDSKEPPIQLERVLHSHLAPWNAENHHGMDRRGAPNATPLCWTRRC
jgi:hypothetical protein